MPIICAGNGHSHNTVDEVRACQLGVRKAPAPVEVTEGMWKLGDRIIKVQIAHHGSGHLYGKELIVTGSPLDLPAGHRWQKLTGAVRMLREQGGRKMTLQEAVQFGRLYGFCCRCGTILTDENSIEAGIGPVCAGKFA